MVFITLRLASVTGSLGREARQNCRRSQSRRACTGQLADAERKVQAELASAKAANQSRVADAEKQAAGIVEAAKATAEAEKARILQSAKEEADQQMVKAKESLRSQVAALAVSGAEQILKREVNAAAHADLLGALKAKL